MALMSAQVPNPNVVEVVRRTKMVIHVDVLETFKFSDCEVGR